MVRLFYVRMKQHRFQFTIISIVIAASFFCIRTTYAANPYQVTVKNNDRQLEILDTTDGSFSLPVTIQLSNDTRDIQAMWLQIGATYTLVALVREDNKVRLQLFDTTGNVLGKKRVFKMNPVNGKTINIMRFQAAIVNGQFQLATKAIKLRYNQPIKVLQKNFTVNVNNSNPFTLASIHPKDITYPDLDHLSNEEGGLALLNFERESAGLLPVSRNSTLDQGCVKHVEYMRRNDILSHGEDSSKSGYTEEGAKAGMNSDLGGNVTTSMPHAIIQWTTAIYHRFPMLGNGLNTVGWAVSSLSNAGYYYTCLNVYGDADIYALSGTEVNTLYYDVDNFPPIPYPGVNQHYVPTTFSSGESPDPITAFGGEYPVGQPISLTFPSDDTVTDLAMTLKDEKGNTISGYFRAPDDPTDPNTIYQGNSVSFIPKTPLKNSTTHQVKVTGKRNNKDYSKEWQFRTE